MFGKEKKAEDKKKETALKREENRKKSGVKHKKPKQKQAGNGNLSCLFGLCIFMWRRLPRCRPG